MRAKTLADIPSNFNVLHAVFVFPVLIYSNPLHAADFGNTMRSGGKNHNCSNSLASRLGCFAFLSVSEPLLLFTLISRYIQISMLAFNFLLSLSLSRSLYLSLALSVFSLITVSLKHFGFQSPP